MGRRSQYHKAYIQGLTSGGTLPTSPPQVTSVSPNTVINNTPQTFTVTGLNFTLNDAIYYRGTAYGTTRIDSTHLSAANVPSGAVGTAPLYVKRTDGSQSGTVNITVT
jgi:IPT/TIG domain